MNNQKNAQQAYQKQKQYTALQQKLQKYQKLQKEWKQQKQLLNKNISLMQQQITKQKILNNKLLHKQLYKHKRTCSDEQTFIFNQTNISSYYPIIMYEKNNKNKTKFNNNNWINKANLRSHLDSIRCLYWQGSYLLSAGEDCLLKIWQRDRLKITVREHLAPIFTICGDSQSIFTAGAQGVIRKWNVQTFLQNRRPVIQGQFHQDTIWEMIWNKYNNLLITSSSDNSIKIIKSNNDYNSLSMNNSNNNISHNNQNIMNNNIMEQLYQFIYQYDTPTSISYINNIQFISGFVNNKKILLYQLEKCKKIAQFSFLSAKQEQQNMQVNKLLYINKNKMIISAHQDKIIRFFDYNSGKIIKSIVAHSDSVTNLCVRNGHNNIDSNNIANSNINNNMQLLSCSHDGTLRIWDIRKFKCINDIGIHMKKYDQSLLSIAYSQQQALVAVGGADGQIKLLSPQ